MTLNTPVRRALRTLGQLIAAGGLTSLVSALADGLSSYAAGIILGGWTVVVTLVVNSLEAAGTIPTVLPTSSSSHAGEEVSLPLVASARKS